MDKAVSRPRRPRRFTKPAAPLLLRLSPGIQTCRYSDEALSAALADEPALDVPFDGPVRGHVVTPSAGDVFVRGVGRLAHMGLVEAALRPTAKTNLLFVWHCVRRGCKSTVYAAVAWPPTSLAEAAAATRACFLRYVGPDAHRVRERACYYASLFAPRMVWSRAHLIRVLLRSCELRDAVALRRWVAHFRRLAEAPATVPLPVICSGLISVAFLLALDDVGLGDELVRLLPIDPTGCTPYVMLRTLPAQYWQKSAVVPLVDEKLYAVSQLAADPVRPARYVVLE